MKSKISKILGVVVTLSIIASLMVAATALPTSAAPTALNFGTISAPSNVGNVLGGNNLAGTTPYGNTGINFLASTNDGTTMFAWDTVKGILYKSTNSGVSWAAVGNPAAASGYAGTPVALLISPKFATDSTVVAVTTANAFISSNAGATFAGAPTPTLDTAETISCADIGVYYATGATTVFIGMTGGTTATHSNVQMFPLATAGVYSWSDYGGLTTAGIGDFRVYGIKYSPNHASDSEIVILANNAAGATVGSPTVYSSFAGANFGNPCPLPGSFTANPTGAVIAMGTDYNGLSSANTLAIGIQGAAGALPDLYRVTGRTSGAAGAGSAIGLGLGSVKSIAINAPIATATVLVGFTGSATVESVSAFTGTPAPAAAAASPQGTGNGTVIWAGTKAYAGNTGADGGFFMSSDGGVTFHAISLVNVTSVGPTFSISMLSLAVADNNDMMLILGNTAGGAAQQLWVTSNGGTSWMRALVSSATFTINSVEPSPTYTTDKTFFVSQGASGASNLIATTTNGGNTFTMAIAGVKSNVLTAVSGTKYYFGGNAGTFYSSAAPFTAATFTGGTTANVFSIAVNPKDATNIAVGLSDGSVWTSTDSGVTFAKLAPTSGSTGTAPVYVAFGPDGSLYALGSSSAGANRWVVSSSAWLNLGPTFATGSGLAVTPDGTLYASDSTAPGGIWRSLYPTAVNSLGAAACQFQQLNNANGFSGMAAGAAVGVLSTVSTATDNALYVVDTATTGTNYAYPNIILGFDDTMIVAPALTSPANAAQIATSTTAAASWNAITGGTVYQVLSDDTSSAFGGNNMQITGALTGAVWGASGLANDCTPGTSATIGNVALTGGSTYYWEVRVVSVDPLTAQNNLNSRWSKAWSFTTTIPAVGYGVTQALVPAIGATGVAVDGTFAWPAGPSSTTSYDFVIAEDQGTANHFAIIDFGDTTAINAYKLKEPLKYNTAYWWEVRADSGTSVGAWTVGYFTTEPMPAPTTTSTAAVVTPTVIVTAPTQPAITPTVTIVNSGTGSTTPVIPTYLLWLVIVVGAVLVIAVIVLIVRTRRIS